MPSRDRYWCAVAPRESDRETASYRMYAAVEGDPEMQVLMHTSEDRQPIRRLELRHTTSCQVRTLLAIENAIKQQSEFAIPEYIDGF